MIYLCLGNIKVNLWRYLPKKIPSIFGGWKQLIGYSKLTLRELEQLYPNVKKKFTDISIRERVVDFRKIQRKSYNDIKNDISYLEWLVTIKKLSIEDFKSLTTE